jgi:hypothetical protein
MGKLGTQRDWVTCERQLKLNDLLNDSFIQSKHPVLVSFSVTVTTCLGQSIYKERRFIFAQEFRRFSPWSVKLISFGPVASEHIVVRNTWQWNPIHLLARWKRQRKRTWSHSPLQGQVHNGLHPPTRPHLLQVPLPPISTMLGTKSFPHGPYKWAFKIQRIAPPASSQHGRWVFPTSSKSDVAL